MFIIFKNYSSFNPMKFASQLKGQVLVNCSVSFALILRKKLLIVSISTSRRHW